MGSNPTPSAICFKGLAAFQRADAIHFVLRVGDWAGKALLPRIHDCRWELCLAKIKQMPNNFTTLGRRIWLPLVLWLAASFCAQAQTVTNLQQLAQALNQQPRLFRNVDLTVTV